MRKWSTFVGSFVENIGKNFNSIFFLWFFALNCMAAWIGRKGTLMRKMSNWKAKIFI
jgi:hypothetical protein